jgi:hypothetical protein
MAEDGRPVSVSIVEGRAAAMAADDRAREWVAADMADLLPDPPEVVMGEMLVDAATFDEDDEEERDGASDAPWMDGGV